MILRDGGLIAKRGITLPITVRESIGAEELLEKAVEKHHRFNKDVVRSGTASDSPLTRAHVLRLNK